MADNQGSLSCSPRYQATCRRVKDCCAVLHNAIHKWAGLNDESSAVASKLVNVVTEGSYGPVGVISNNVELRKRMEGKLLEQQEQMYCSLKHLLSQMGGLVTKMASVVKNLRSIVELLTVQNNIDMPLFSSLNIGTYIQYCQDVFEAYSHELHVKQTIFEDLLTQERRDTVTVYLSCWLHQPFLSHTVSDKLEALLIDSGLRTVN